MAFPEVAAGFAASHEPVPGRRLTMMDNRSASLTAIRERFVAVNATAAGVLLAATCLLRVALDQRWVHARWHYSPHWLWVVAADLAAILLIGFWGSPQRLRRWMAALSPHLVVLGGAVLLALQRFDGVALWTLDLLVCGAVAAGWLIVLGGFVAIAVAPVVRLWTPTMLVRRGWLRWWVAAVAFLGTAEAAVWLLERAASEGPIVSQLTLPGGYRDAPAVERPVVALGGSTMAGFPYQPRISIPVVLAQSLSGDPEQTVVVRNLAVTGDNLLRAADRLKDIEVRPRLLLLYTGHNEYFYDMKGVPESQRWPRRLVDPLLNWSGCYRWLTGCIPQPIAPVQLGDGASIIRRPFLTPEFVQRRQEQFRADLVALAEHCRRHEIPTLWFLPAASEGIFEPNRSIASRHLSEAEERLLNERYRRCRSLIDAGEYELARDELVELSAEFADVAELEFRLGCCLRELGQIHAARECFRRAIDHDAQPACANTAYRTLIAQVAEEFGIEVIDAEETLRRLSPSGLLDRHVIHDNVHPTLRGYFELGLAAARSRTVAAVFAVGPDAASGSLDSDSLLACTKLTPEDLAKAYERTAHCLRTLARLRTDDARRLAEAAHYERWADRLAQQKISPGEEGTEALTGDAIPGVRFE